ncbi:hypothetical protein [Merismopedia glauca]|uniref:Uncharacterized protein n=1 Tax=Merismopedia glauca CCAP 1448/3 TaxID=1296344 RepID=A0A2T1BXJ7_9CYAN|nr:hypothetical protein [Merismopedia glauca]PSB00678.1 hypothetical protein C7B64_22290 [Merismopedia glauca CCAP 1448/3]
MSSSKYGDLIRKAREPDDQTTRQPESQIEPQLSQNSSSSINSSSQKTREPDSQIARQPEKEVNLCVKVPESLRRHWAAEAKRQGITMTEIMTEALTQRFGKPDNQTTRQPDDQKINENP